MNPGSLHDRALRLHQTGNLRDAERLYAQILSAEPANFAVCRLMGILRFQQGRNAEALEALDAALKVNPRAVEALTVYALVLQALGRLPEALAHYEKALAIQPGHVEALYNRGIVLANLNRFADALTSFDAVLVIKPDYAEALNNRGNILLCLKRFEDALASYDKALSIRPGNAQALSNRANALIALRRFDEALAAYDDALALKPGSAEALNNRGGILWDMKRPEAALASYEAALAIRPDFVEALNNRGNALRALDRFEEALESLGKALAIKPDHVEALYNRGIVLAALRRFEGALASYDEALAIKPHYGKALVSRGDCLSHLGRFEEALASYDQALAIAPDDSAALVGRGNVLSSLHRLEDALASYERAHAMDPDNPYALGGAAGAALDLCDWPRTARFAEEIRGLEAARESVIPPLVVLGCTDDSQLQLHYARNYIRDRIPVRPRPLWEGEPYRHPKIRIAYMSSDFRRHPMATVVAELFELHDRSRFEVLGISLGADDRSDVRARLAGAVDRFIDVRPQCDRDAARLLRALEPDIVIDLNGHTKGARPAILGYRPAPVQVSYMGYPGTMGADFIDYVIADKIVLPFARQPFFAEKIVHLPDCYWVNDSKRAMGAPADRRQAGLPERGFVFCCFNISRKITAPLFDIWMRLLAKVPGSVLWLLDDNAVAKGNLLAAAAARGIAPERLVFAPRVSLPDHLARQRLADLCLDTLPYNAHTTASDALWAGLPLVTCPGESFAARVAASLLCATGLSDLIAESLDAYEALALRLAQDPALLQGFRQMLAQNRKTAPLFDTDRFRRHIESAYSIMWEITQRGESARSFGVESDV